MSSRSAIGKIGENVAVMFLEKKGYLVIERNYRKPWGEIDIIAEKNGTIRFIEVKTLSIKDGDFSRERSYMPEEQIHVHKRKKIARTAELYMELTGDTREFQIDAVGVFLDAVRRKARCRLWEQII